MHCNKKVGAMSHRLHPPPKNPAGAPAELPLCFIMNKTKLFSVIMCCTCDLIGSYMVGIWDMAFG